MINCDRSMERKNLRKVVNRKEGAKGEEIGRKERKTGV